MKRQSILLVDADGDCEETVALAAARCGQTVRWIRTSGEVFRSFKSQLQTIGLIVVDVDPGAHGLAVLEAIGACGEKPPMIVLTGLEEAYMAPIAVKHGARACLGKPLNIDKLISAIQKLSADRHLTADHWGHPTPTASGDGAKVVAGERGIAAKMKPGVVAPRRRQTPPGHTSNKRAS